MLSRVFCVNSRAHYIGKEFGNEGIGMKKYNKMLRQKNRAILIALTLLSIAFYLLFLTKAGVL